MMFGIGLLIAICGVGLVIFAGGLFPNSERVTKRERDLLSMRPDELSSRDRGERTYYVINTKLRAVGWWMFAAGALTAFLALLIN